MCKRKGQDGGGRKGCNFAPAELGICLEAKVMIAMLGIYLEIPLLTSRV